MPIIDLKLDGSRRRLGLLFLSIAAITNTASAVDFHEGVYSRVKATYDPVKKFGTAPVVIWGGGLTYEEVYPLFPLGDFDVRTLKLYGLGVTALAPNAIANDQRAKGAGMLDLLLTRRGVEVIASDSYLNLLSVYCEERYERRLETLSSRYSERQPIRRVACVSDRTDDFILDYIFPSLLNAVTIDSNKSTTESSSIDSDGLSITQFESGRDDYILDYIFPGLLNAVTIDKNKRVAVPQQD